MRVGAICGVCTMGACCGDDIRGAQLLRSKIRMRRSFGLTGRVDIR
jgi:hypothetical protein